jgi:IrrE N-terminal-like domain
MPTMSVATMITPDLETLARDFWADMDGRDTFPREIEHAAPLKLPLVLVKQAPINAKTARDWLQQRDMVVPTPDDPRDLCGCLIAHRGYGFIFVSSTDSPEEQRLTIAHEVAHFIVDYLVPRRQVIQALGAQMTAVLDGIRPPTPAERAAAILSHVRLGAHVHVLPRPGTDADREMTVMHAEDRADRLALELVAPLARIRGFLDDLMAYQAFTPNASGTALATHFGLPAYAFHDIIQRIVRRSPPAFVDDILAGLRRQR